jgi:outer membrane protein OmpA-like peptidoglycan-associated protein
LSALRLALTLLGVAAAALMLVAVLVAAPAVAQAFPATLTPTPTPDVDTPATATTTQNFDPGSNEIPEGDVVGRLAAPQPGATYLVEPIRFPTTSADGAVIDNGDRSFRLASDVLFEFDRSDLTPRARQEIAEIATKLSADPAAAVTSVDVVGHTDDVGDIPYNDRLSLARAESVRAELAAALGPGITVTATGRGEGEPIAENTTDAGRAVNRRVEIAAN